MANAIYPSAKALFLTAGLNLSSLTIKAALVTTSGSYSSAHDFYNDVSANVIGTPQTLGSKTTTSGVFDAADVTYTAVAGGSTVGSIVLYNDTGVSSTSDLIAWIDTTSGGPISVATNGGDITVQWDSGANKIFSL